MTRVVQPELLDSLTPGDPRALRSRHDLRRLNTLMGHCAITLGVLQTHLPAAPRQMTELGAGDGQFLLGLAEKTSVLWPSVNVTLLDRQRSVSTETLDSFGRLGWRAEAVVADVFDWSPPANLEEVVVTNLFLHHFEDLRLAELLKIISQHARLFVAIEPRRFSRPSLFAPLLRLIRCNDVTRHDAIASIRAGFVEDEISSLWPDRKNWRLSERSAGLFSHLFVAQRQE